MGCFEEVTQEGPETNQHNAERSICLHAFSDLSRVPAATFVCLLKDCYLYGTHKASLKFRIVRQLVKLALHNTPQPGPFTYVVQCMYIVPLLGKTYAEGLSHMLTSSLRHLKSVESAQKDFLEAKLLAARLVLDILDSLAPHGNRILVKILEAFDVELRDIAHALYGSELDGNDLVNTKEHLKKHVKCFMNSESYGAAVAMITHFSIQCCDESFLIKLIESNQFEVAEECATFMGKEMVCFIIQKYLNMKMLKSANKLVKEHDLTEEFPDVSFLYKESVVKKLAEKGCWDIAEVRAKKEMKLIEYLVYLAMEACYMEKVDELCQRYSLEDYVDSLGSVREEIFCGSEYLDLKKLGSEEIVWVDEIDGLLNATNYIEHCKVIGLDCEWKPNFEKNSNPNKVSIIQIASDEKAFIFDLIKLYDDCRKALDSCFRRIMCSNTLKLGYDVQCDLHQLSRSYGELECFQSYEMLLDVQKLFGATGGLSGLSKKLLGSGLNKAWRNSNWELRPLSQNQKEYAALDAVVLVHIFNEHIGKQPQFGVSERSRLEWKSHIVTRVNCRPTSLHL